MIKRNLIILLSLILVIFAGTTGCKGEILAKNGDAVKVHYTGRLSDGTVFDSSEDGDPLEFTLGQGQMIAGFEQAVLGMKVGETKTVNIPSDQAYGPRSDDLIMDVDRNELPDDMEPWVGLQLQMDQADGSTTIVTITEVSDTNVKLDANHPLAGKDLVFDIEIMEISKSKTNAVSTFTSISLQEAFASGKPTLAEFGSNTCIPCKQMKPILVELATEYKDTLNVVIVEVYEQKELTQQHKIMAIPTQIVFDSDGKELTRHVGLWPIIEIITQLKDVGIH
jgi:peptidylprolyl isomerase